MKLLLGATFALLVLAPYSSPGADTPPQAGVPEGIVVRTTENVTSGGWVYLLNQCQERGIARIDLLVKQDNPGIGAERLMRLRRAHPFDATVLAAIDATLALYAPGPQPK